MADIEERIDGLDGAIGCQLLDDRNQLFFVEYGGKLSRLDLTRGHASTVSEGEATIQGTYFFDLDNGEHSDRGEGFDDEPGMDIWWRQRTDTEREMTPGNGAEIANLGVVGFGSVSSAEIQDLSYSDEPINGNDDDTNQLVDGDVFAVRTTQGNLAKVEVLDYGYDLRIRWRTYELSSPYQVLGTGYDRPEDVVVSSDGSTAYITERGGNLLIVDPTDADRSEATVLVSDLERPHQMVLDEERSQAFLVEFADPGRLVRVDLTSGATSTLFSGLDHAIGLAMSDDRETAYVTEQAADGDRLIEIDLVEERREVLQDALENPFFLEWAGPERDQLLFTERDPSNAVLAFDLSEETTEVLADGVPFRPSSLAVVDPYRLLVCSGDVISEIDPVGGYFGPSDPMLLGIGRVPETFIEQTVSDPAVGTATTAGEGIGLSVEQAPFGGTLPIKINHERAFEAGARYYRLLIVDEATGEEIEPRQPFTDHRWTTSTDRFERETISPRSGGYYRVRGPHELWYDHWLGYALRTGILDDGLHTLQVKFYEDASRDSEMPALTEELKVTVDNGWPRAEIQEIIHHLKGGGEEIVDACAIVDSKTDDFTFNIVANDPQGHLKSWKLRARWGDNQADVVQQESYDPSVKGHTWNGPNPAHTDRWDATERHCAHTFRLVVWDRVINGRGHIHRSTYHKSITLLVPGRD